MIEKEQLITIGRIGKPHGLKGEMTAVIENDIFDTVESCPYLICETEGIFVPFFIENYRFRSDTTILLKLEEIDTQEDAREFSNRTLYFDRRCFTSPEAAEYEAEQEENADSFIGYHIVDHRFGDLGTVSAIDAQTANVLFIVDRNGSECLIPAADNLIDRIDDNRHIVFMTLPPGLIDPEEAESE